MRKFIGNFLNLIGNILIGLANLISFARTTLLFILTIAIVMGVLIITMIGFFELFGKISPDPEFQMVVLGKWYWDVIAVVLGGSTMWLGFTKLWENDDKNKKKEYIY